jgi:F0F1-type ATP synthase membrane subunit b/b'
MDQNDPVGIGPQEGGPVTTTDYGRVPSAAATLLPSFLAELTRAMQAAAEQQRDRIAAVVADEAADQVDKARSRAAVEAEELRRLAEEDVGRIQAWSADETERIRREASRRTDELRKDLEEHLAQHESIIVTEIDGVGVAVRDYRSTLDQFFDELRGATDPAQIARRAGSLPAPPDLESIRGDARASAVARFANAPQDATDEPVGEELGRAFEAAPGPSADVDVGDEWAVAGAGLGVMDPEAVGRSEDLPIGPAVEDAVAASVQRSSAAVRLVRSIAPWTMAEQDEEDRGTQGP